MLEAELTTSRSVVVVWSQKSIKSDRVQEEASEGRRRRVLVPVRIDPVDPPFGYRQIQAADLAGWDGSTRAVSEPPHPATKERLKTGHFGQGSSEKRHGFDHWGDSLANYLKMPKRQQVLALLALKWSFRRIERETGVRRETISGYARQADPDPARTFPDSEGRPRFAAAAYRDAITEKLELGLVTDAP